MRIDWKSITAVTISFTHSPSASFPRTYEIVFTPLVTILISHSARYRALVRRQSLLHATTDERSRNENEQSAALTICTPQLMENLNMDSSNLGNLCCSLGVYETRQLTHAI